MTTPILMENFKRRSREMNQVSPKRCHVTQNCRGNLMYHLKGNNGLGFPGVSAKLISSKGAGHEIKDRINLTQDTGSSGKQS
jgi:hypothetical protein